MAAGQWIKRRKGIRRGEKEERAILVRLNIESEPSNELFMIL